MGGRATRPPDRIRVRRNPKKGRYERSTVEQILDRGLVAHVAFVDGGEPVCIPMLYTRIGGAIYVHGSRASRAIRLLAAGRPACLTVTLTQGLVLARSAFEHSANYESVVAFGRFEPIDDPAERLAALAAFTNKLLPGRWDEVRQPSAKELKATTILALPIDEASAKVRYGPARRRRQRRRRTRRVGGRDPASHVVRRADRLTWSAGRHSDSRQHSRSALRRRRLTGPQLGRADVVWSAARKQPWMWSLTMPTFCMNAYTLVGPTNR